MTCSHCGAQLLWIEDGCSTDRGWKDESYYICPIHGEAHEEIEPEFSPQELDQAANATTERIKKDLHLGPFQLEVFQQKVAKQRRDWRLVLICAHDAGCKSFPSLMRFIRTTNKPQTLKKTA